jgi:putative spermidine/putrescine transport system permease protein
MSSSSSGEPPEPPSQEAARIALDEVEEAEALLEQHPPTVEKALGERQGGRGRRRGGGWITFAWGLPGFVWLGFFLIAPLVFIVLMSFWTPDTSTGFVKQWTLHNYGQLLHPFSLNNAYWKDMLRSFQISAIAVAACLVFGFPVAYFLAMKVKKLQYQIALFILALAPFWTSFITRSVAWAYPLMGSHGALNQFLVKIGVSSYDHPLIDTQFTQLSVQLAMIQLYILFMVTPIFFLLAQVDRHAIEAARDLGGNWWGTFREVILPQTMPGIVIGSIFIFVLTMGEYGTVEVISQGAVTTVGVYVHSQIIGTQYPQGAASAVLLVFVLILGVIGITRFANLREEI